MDLKPDFMVFTVDYGDRSVSFPYLKYQYHLSESELPEGATTKQQNEMAIASARKVCPQMNDWDDADVFSFCVGVENRVADLGNARRP